MIDRKFLTAFSLGVILSTGFHELAFLSGIFEPPPALDSSPHPAFTSVEDKPQTPGSLLSLSRPCTSPNHGEDVGAENGRSGRIEAEGRHQNESRTENGSRGDLLNDDGEVVFMHEPLHSTVSWWAVIIAHTHLLRLHLR